MASINYSQLGRKLLKKYPDLTKELIDSSKPAFNSFALIPDLKEIYDKFQDPPKYTKELINYCLVFISVIVRFYDPDVIYVENLFSLVSVMFTFITGLI